MEVTWAQVVNNFLPLVGVIIGGVATYVTQNNLVRKQLKSEQEKERRKEDMERLKIYSEILEFDGLYTMYDSIGQLPFFKLHEYRRDFRPILFSKLYLLNQDIADKAAEMDKLMAHSVSFEEMDEKDVLKLVRLHKEVISLVEGELRDYRAASR